LGISNLFHVTNAGGLQASSETLRPAPSPNRCFCFEPVTNAGFQTDLNCRSGGFPIDTARCMRKCPSGDEHPLIPSIRPATTTLDSHSTQGEEKTSQLEEATTGGVTHAQPCNDLFSNQLTLVGNASPASACIGCGTCDTISNCE
jgi:ferredoxin